MFGLIAIPRRVRELSDQGCFCSTNCTGGELGCTNQEPTFASEQWAYLTTGRGLHPYKYLRAKKDIPAGTFITTFLGIIVQQCTHKEAFGSFARIHAQQHMTEGADKFQYSVLVGSERLPGSLAWFIPQNDLCLLRRLLGPRDQELLALTKARLVGRGLGQYAQHTCCLSHVNTHLFPICILREGQNGHQGRKEWEDDEWMQVRGVALRAERLIREGEEILVHYVGAGRSGNFQKVFKCSCCLCSGRCKPHGRGNSCQHGS